MFWNETATKIKVDESKVNGVKSLDLNSFRGQNEWG